MQFASCDPVLEPGDEAVVLIIGGKSRFYYNTRFSGYIGRVMAGPDDFNPFTGEGKLHVLVLSIYCAVVFMPLIF